MARREGVPLPTFAELHFASETRRGDPRHRYVVRRAEESVAIITDALWTRVVEIIDQSGLRRPSQALAVRHLNEFRIGIPAHDPVCLGDIINGGWLRYAEIVKTDTPEKASAELNNLNEVLLKTIEVLEYLRRALAMILGAKSLAAEIRRGNEGDAAGIAIVPAPDLAELEKLGEASVSLRLGRWFVTMRLSSETAVSTVYEPSGASNVSKLSKEHFVPFGSEFVLHPNRFVLGGTLEWIRLPPTYAAFVVGKSESRASRYNYRNGRWRAPRILRLLDFGNR